MKRRVVVTGLGVFSSIGSNTEEFYQNLLDGKSGISLIDAFDITDFPVKIAGEIKNYKANDWFPKEERNDVKRMDRFCQFALIAAKEAMEDSKLDLEKEDTTRIGVITGSGIGGLISLQENYKKMLERGPARVSPLFIPMMIADIASGRISIKYGLKGPNYTTVSACASSGHAIGNSYKSIIYGDADIMVTGGAEAVICETAVAGFANMKATSRNNEEPTKASRPFDKGRNGFVMGEGSGMLVLEEYEHAKARGAKIYAEIVGVGYSADAYDIVMPDENGDGAQRAMKMAIDSSNLKPEDIDHINTHGTSTPRGDIAETVAIKRLFGDHAYKISVNSTKSMIGHLLGAAGAVETIATIKAVETDTVHPTINLDEADPECDLDYTANKYRKRIVNAALSNTFGFGGHNASILIKKCN